MVRHTGAASLGELTDRLGLTKMLGWHQVGGRRHHLNAAVLRDLAMLADGGDCLSDLAALRDQPELFGPVASTRPPRGSSNESPATQTGWPGCVARAHARAWAADAHPS